MRLPVLAAAAMLMAGPAFAQGTTTTPSGTTAALPGATTVPPRAPRRSGRPRRRASPTSTRRAGAATSRRARTPPGCGPAAAAAARRPPPPLRAAMPTRPPRRPVPRRVVPRGGDPAGPVGHPTGPSPPPRRSSRAVADDPSRRSRAAHARGAGGEPQPREPHAPSARPVGATKQSAAGRQNTPPRDHSERNVMLVIACMAAAELCALAGSLLNGRTLRGPDAD